MADDPIFQDIFMSFYSPDPPARFCHLLAIRRYFTIVIQGGKTFVTAILQKAEACQSSVIVAYVESCDALRPREFAFAEEVVEKVDVEVVEGDDTMGWPDAVRTPSELNPLA